MTQQQDQETIEPPAHEPPRYVLNRYNEKGELADAIWIDEHQYRRIKSSLLRQGFQLVDDEGNDIPGQEVAEPVFPDLKDFTMAQLRIAAKAVRERNPQDRFDAEWRLLGSALDLSESDDHELAFLAVFQRMLWEHQGVGTPFEELIFDLMSTYQHRAPSAAEVREDIETFERSWADTLNDARRFYRDHRDLVTGESDDVNEAA